MRLYLPTLFLPALIMIIGGCATKPLPALPRPGVPLVHKIDVQQGNVVTQEMVAQLRLGMNRKKVRFVMGTPIIQDTFHSSRWDYIYTFHEGGGGTERRRVTTVFNEDGKLIAVEGDIKAALGRLEVDRHQDTSVKVPGEYRKGFIGRIADSMPFTGDDEQDAEQVAEAAEEVGADDEEKLERDRLEQASETDALSAEADEALVEDDEDRLEQDLLDADDAENELIAEAEANAVTVPGGAPPQRKKSLVERMIDAVGLGADEEEQDDEDEDDYDDDRRYRDPTDPDTVNRPY